jgi:hypothetical protein
MNNKELLFYYYSTKSEWVWLKDIICKNILYNFIQQPELKNSKQDKIENCKTLTLLARNKIAKDEKNKILEYINETLKQDKKKLESFVFINEWDFAKQNNNKEYLKTRDITNKESIIDMIKTQNNLFKFYKNRLQQRDEDNESYYESYLWEFMKKINEKFFLNNSVGEDKDIINIVDREINKEIEYYIITQIINQINTVNKTKKERCSYALSYLTNELPKETDMMEIRQLPDQWCVYYAPIIDTLIAETQSAITDNKLILNQSKSAIWDNIMLDEDKTILFAQRCRAVKDWDSRREYTLWKDIIRELWYQEINLNK